MKNSQLTHKELLQKYKTVLANKTRKGFVIVEKNEKLPFTIMCKKGKTVNHALNFFLFCATLGIWLLVWIYISYVSSKEKLILVAIDEDGNVFEDKCYC